MHWDALLKEVLDKNSKLSVLAYTCSTKRNNKKFFLGPPYPEIYFTNREAEVMVQLLLGKTISAVAFTLNLSSRTIEFYVKNMKTKLGCRTKSELIGKVFASDFIRKVDFMSTISSDRQ